MKNFMILFLVKLGFGKLTVDQKLNKANFIIGKLTGNPDFPVTDPTLAALTTATEEASAAAAAAETGDHQSVAIKKQKVAVLDKLMARLQSDINTKANGNVAKILGAGFEVSKPRTPAAKKGPVEGLTIKLGANPGEVVLKWKAIKGGSLNAIAYAENPVAGIEMRPVAQTTKSKITISNLQSGVVYYFRIAVINSAGVGPWSEAISIRVY